MTDNEIRAGYQSGLGVVQDTIRAERGEKEVDPESAQEGNLLDQGQGTGVGRGAAR